MTSSSRSGEGEGKCASSKLRRRRRRRGERMGGGMSPSMSSESPWHQCRVDVVKGSVRV